MEEHMVAIRTWAVEQAMGLIGTGSVSTPADVIAAAGVFEGYVMGTAAEQSHIIFSVPSSA